MADGEHGRIYEKLDNHDMRLTKLESTRPYLEDLTERSIKSYESLAQTMQDVQLSMVKMNDKMDEQSKSLNALKEDMANGNKNMSEKINIIETKVAKIDDEGKFNIRTYLKANWPWIVVILGMGWMVASQYVKF